MTEFLMRRWSSADATLTPVSHPLRLQEAALGPRKAHEP
jgi:hypothetical protein